MPEVVINNIKEAIKLFEEKLNEAVNLLNQVDKISVDRVTALESYNPRLSRGGFGIIFNGNNFAKDERIGGTSLIMKDDIYLGVISAIRFYETSTAPVDSYAMIPAEYTELAVNTLSGIEVWNKRPENERKIYPIRTELVDEENGLWKYMTTFCIPKDFVEQSLLE